MEDKKNEFVFYFVDAQTKENKKDKQQEIGQNEKNNISINKNVDDSLNKFVHSIFYKDKKYNQNNKYYVIDDLQMNLIINEVEWHTKFTECILKKEVKLQSREVLLLYQVFVTRILYMILLNHSNNLEDYVKTNDLKSKFDVLCDEFVKSIPDFKTKEDVLNFLFDKMLDTDKHKNDIDQMKYEILDCVDSLLANENNNGDQDYYFKIDDENKIAKTNSCCITSYESKIYYLKKYHFNSNKSDEDESDEDKSDKFKSNVNKSYHHIDLSKFDFNDNGNKSYCFEVDEMDENEKTKWSKAPGRQISLRQTEEIRTQNDIIDYNKLEPIDKLLENNHKHIYAICFVAWEKEDKEIENKTPISYKTLLPYLDKNNENADRNFEAILNCCNLHELNWKYLKPIIQIGIRSFKEIFMPNSVLKEYWTQKKFLEPTEDNFDNLLDTLKELDFNTDYQDFGIFKYKDEDGNFYTHSLVLKNLANFCYQKQIVDDYKDDDQYTMITHKIKVKPEYENDFKNIKIKPNTVRRADLINNMRRVFMGFYYYYEKKYQEDVLNKQYYQCLKLIPIQELLKTKIYDDEEIKYLCDFDMLNDINDKCENIQQMVKQTIKEAMIKNDAIKMDEDHELHSFELEKLDEKDQDDYIEKNCYHYNIFEGNNLSEIISKKLKDETIKIRSDNHEVIKAIFKTFKYKFDDYGVNKNKKNYFSQCCDLVKELCAKYEDEKEFITCELFGTMLDHITDWFCRCIDIKDYATILFQLGESSGKKSYKFTTDQQIGLLRLYLDKLNNANKENKNSIRYGVPRIFEIIIQQHNEVKLDQKVIDYLFLTINDAQCLDILLMEINDPKYNFSLSLNLVERMFDLFINDKDLQDDIRKIYLSELVNYVILNDKINFISDDKRQIDEIKDAKEKERQIRLNFIKMYLKKINGNKKLIDTFALNSAFKYFDDSLETKKEIANKIIDCGFRFDKNKRLYILNETQKDDQEELKEILSKWEKEEKKESESKISKIEKEKEKESEIKTENKETHKNQHDNTEMNQNGKLNMITSNSIKNEIKTTESQIYPQKDIELTDQTEQSSFFNWSIYFAIALIIIVVILTFVFKEPLILFALLAPIIIFVYRFIKRCKKSNPEQKKTNLKTNNSPQQKSISDRIRNINLDENNPNEKIILDEEENPSGYINNLNENEFE